MADVGALLMKRIAISLLIILSSACADTSVKNPNAVRERDEMRKEVSKTMPGNEIPKDPADD